MKDLGLLGLRVRDKVTGWTGVVSCVSFDLYGCIQAVVSPPVDDKGAIQDGRWFDVSRLIVLDVTPVMEIPGDKFRVRRRALGVRARCRSTARPATMTERTAERPFVTNTHGPAEKPAR